jgi:hypothetical protein
MKPSRVMLAAACIAMLSPREAGAELDVASANHVMQGHRQFVAQANYEIYLQRKCVGAVDAVMDYGDGICPPRGSKMGQGVRVVVTYIDSKPARLHENFNKLALEALRNAWPCR